MHQITRTVDVGIVLTMGALKDRRYEISEHMTVSTTSWEQLQSNRLKLKDIFESKARWNNLKVKHDDTYLWSCGRLGIKTLGRQL